MMYVYPCMAVDSLEVSLEVCTGWPVGYLLLSASTPGLPNLVSMSIAHHKQKLTWWSGGYSTKRYSNMDWERCVWATLYLHRCTEPIAHKPKYARNVDENANCTWHHIRSTSRIALECLQYGVEWRNWPFLIFTRSIGLPFSQFCAHSVKLENVPGVIAFEERRSVFVLARYSCCDGWVYYYYWWRGESGADSGRHTCTRSWARRAARGPWRSSVEVVAYV